MVRIAILCLTSMFLWACAPPSVDEAVDAAPLKQIALTYDDAPRGNGPVYSGPDRTQAILEQLSAAETGPVAFFVTTKGLAYADGKARVKAYADAGHRIANHSHTHMWASRTDTQDYIDDIDRAEAELAGFANRRPWYRFPYLDEGGRGDANQGEVKRDILRAALDERGLISGYVTVDTFDWHLASIWRREVQAGKTVDMDALSKVYTDMVVDAAVHYDALGLQVLGRRPAQNVLLHENNLAAAFTKDLVVALRADGWTIIDPDIAFADPIARQIPTTLFSGAGRISALAADAGLKGPEVFDHWSADEKAIEARVLAAKVFK